MNKFCIYFVKFEVMIFSKMSFIGFVFFIYFGNNFINVVNYIICLGLIIDNRFIWVMYVDYVKKFFV